MNKRLLTLILSIIAVITIFGTKYIATKAYAKQDSPKQQVFLAKQVSMAARRLQDLDVPIDNTQTEQPLPPTTCPNDMVEVEGSYCPSVEEICLRWLDTDQSPTANGGIGPMRCAEFKSPTKCLSHTRKHMHFCMSKFEYPGTENSFPLVGMNYWDAKIIAAKDNNRLCTKDEFNFACEGEDMHPYGYGDGFHRDATICNIDKNWVDFKKFNRSQWNDRDAGLYQGVASDSNSLCRSVFGVYNINGNVDEILDSENSKNVILSGGYWSVIRSRCRPMTNSHEKLFSFYQVGFRECKDVN